MKTSIHTKTPCSVNPHVPLGESASTPLRRGTLLCKLLLSGIAVSLSASGLASMGGLCFVKSGATPDALGYWWFDAAINWMVHKQYPDTRSDHFPSLGEDANLNSTLLSNPATPLYIKDGDHAETLAFVVGMGRYGWSGGMQYFTMYGGTMTNANAVYVGASDGLNSVGEGIVDFRAGEWTVVSNSFYISSGDATNTRDSYGCMTVHDGARLNVNRFAANNNCAEIVLGYGDNSYGVLTNMGYVSASRITLCPWPGNNHLGEKALLVMRGGTFYASDQALTNRNSVFSLDFLKIGGYLGEATIRGWGKFDRGGNKNKNKENIAISTMMGKVIADGEGEERDLNLGWFHQINNGLASDDANWAGENGWFAVNKGRLIYPYRVETTSLSMNLVRGDGGKSASNVNHNYDNPSKLINTVHLKGTISSGTAYNIWAHVQLYAADRTDYPSLAPVAPKSSHGKCLGVFRLGIFNSGDNSTWNTNPTGRRDFSTMNVKIRYDDLGLRTGRDKITLYRYDDTEGWKALTTVDYDPEDPYISAEDLTPRASTKPGGVSDNWNLGWFAVQSDREVKGLIISFH